MSISSDSLDFESFLSDAVPQLPTIHVEGVWYGAHESAAAVAVLSDQIVAFQEHTIVETRHNISRRFGRNDVTYRWKRHEACRVTRSPALRKGILWRHKEASLSTSTRVWRYGIRISRRCLGLLRSIGGWSVSVVTSTGAGTHDEISVSSMIIEATRASKFGGKYSIRVKSQVMDDVTSRS